MQEEGYERCEDGTSCCCDADGVEDESGIESGVKSIETILDLGWPIDIR